MTDHYAVYEHIRPDTGAVFYVGKGIPRRVKLLARRDNPYHTHIRAKLRKMGLDVEVRIIADHLPEESSLALEKMRIAYLRAIGVNLVNLTDGGDGLRNPSDEVRAKIADAKIGAKNPNFGKRASDELRAKLSDSHSGERHWNYGKKASEETRAKMRATRATEEYRTKMRLKMSGENHPNYGKTLPVETRSKMSAAHSGAKNPNYGKKASDEYRAKMSAAHIGKTPTDETRAKMRAAQKAAWAKRKAERAAA